MLNTYPLELLNLVHDEAELTTLRNRLGIEESFLGLDLSLTGTDRAALHAVLRKSFDDRTVLGYACLEKPAHDGAAGQFAVLRWLWTQFETGTEGQSSEIATSLLRWAKEAARERALSGLVFSTTAAQCTLTPLAAQLWEYGFRASAPPPEDAPEAAPEAPERLHFELVLARTEAHWRQPNPVSRQVKKAEAQSSENLGKSQAIGGKTKSDLQQSTLLLLERTQREFCLYTRDLDPLVLDTQAVLDAIKAVGLREKARIRALVQDPQRAIKNGHRLIELSRRLPSTLSFRVPHAEDQQFPGAFCCNDQFGFLHRNFGDRFECEGDLYAVAERNRWARYFDDVWERAQEASEFRRLGL